MNATTSRHRALGKIINLGNKGRMVFFHKNWRPRRSVLFMPASNKRALEKAATFECDAVIFDLEDAVSEAEQEGARENLRTHVKGKRFPGKELVIRISQGDSSDFEDDLRVAIECAPDAVLVPKVESDVVLANVETAISTAGITCEIWAMIETPKALMNLQAITAYAQTGPLGCLVVGPNDLSKSTGAAMQKGRAVMLPWLMQVVAAARAHNLCVLDGVYNAFRDVEGLAAECAQGAEMGFDGKTLIHPAQIEVANKAFSPSREELEKARSIVSLFEDPANQNKGALQMNGEMVERLHLDSARKLMNAFGGGGK